MANNAAGAGLGFAGTQHKEEESYEAFIVPDIHLRHKGV